MKKIIPTISIIVMGLALVGCQPSKTDAVCTANGKTVVYDNVQYVNYWDNMTEIRTSEGYSIKMAGNHLCVIIEVPNGIDAKSVETVLTPIVER